MATQTSVSKDDILEAIGNMSVFELAELIEAFKEKFGVTIAAPVAAAPAGGGGGGGTAAGAAPAAEEKTEFTVILKSAGEKKIQVIKEIRARSEEHTSELQSRSDLVCRLLLEKKKKKMKRRIQSTLRMDR